MRGFEVDSGGAPEVALAALAVVDDDLLLDAESKALGPRDVLPLYFSSKNHEKSRKS